MTSPANSSFVMSAAPPTTKIALFRSLFRGREDVFPRRWENATTGKAGYAPACRNEWVRGVCGKPAIKCTSARASVSESLIPFSITYSNVTLRPFYSSR